MADNNLKEINQIVLFESLWDNPDAMFEDPGARFA